MANRFTNSKPGRSLPLLAALALSFCCATVSLAQPPALPTVPAFPGADYNVLDPAAIPKYVQPLVIPPAMPKSNDPKADYNIAVRQFKQQILPGGVWNTVNLRNDPYPATTVWSYGKAEDPYNLNYTAPQPLSVGTTFNYPALTIENTQNKLTRVRWLNQLYDPTTLNYLPHLLPVDRTLHWANPEQLACMSHMGGPPVAHTDCMPDASNGPILLQPYTGPVPIVTHLHGAHVNPESDGYPEAWWLPAANNIPAGYAAKGGLFDQFDRSNTVPGSALFGYYNTQRASMLWYHDHGLGITRVNVYAGPAGFWPVRGLGGSEPDLLSGVIPGPAPIAGEDPNFNAAVRAKIREVPIVIEDRTFKPNGELFFPDNRAFFEGLNAKGGVSPTLDIPFFPDPAVLGTSDIAPIWNPEFFGNSMVVNGTTWPVYNVAQAKYRLRFLDGCNARAVILRIVDQAGLDSLIAGINNNPPIRPAVASALNFWQIGSEGGLLPAPAQLDHLLISPAERADVIVDFSSFAPGAKLYLINEGPDYPFGGEPVTVDTASDPRTTGQVIQFVVDSSLNGASPTDATATAPGSLAFAPIQGLIPDAPTRLVSLNELESSTVYVPVDMLGAYIPDAFGNISQCDPATFVPVNPGDACVPFGPKDAKVGTVAGDSINGYTGVPLNWTDMTGASTMVKVFTKANGTPVMTPVSEMPRLNSTEEWDIFNYTMDAHPIHLHLVAFQVVNREPLTTDAMGLTTQPAFLTGQITPPEAWETGWKDTVVAYPGQVTRIKAKFTIAGQYVWHCHIIDHEDNEMMRPYAVIPDLDGNGCVDKADFNKLNADIRSGHGAYDINGDGKVDISDARRLTLFFTNPGGAPCP